MNKANFALVAIIAALSLLAAPMANAVEANSSGTQPCGGGGPKNPNSCRGQCYETYEKYICGNPTPGKVGKHKKELKQCYQSCKAGK
jgi:hypothetical protein